MANSHLFRPLTLACLNAFRLVLSTARVQQSPNSAKRQQQPKRQTQTLPGSAELTDTNVTTVPVKRALVDSHVLVTPSSFSANTLLSDVESPAVVARFRALSPPFVPSSLNS